MNGVQVEVLIGRNSSRLQSALVGHRLVSLDHFLCDAFAAIEGWQRMLWSIQEYKALEPLADANLTLCAEWDIKGMSFVAKHAFFVDRHILQMPMENRNISSAQLDQWFPFTSSSALTPKEPLGMWHMFDGRGVMVFEIVVDHLCADPHIMLRCLFLPGSTRGARFMPTGEINDWEVSWRENSVVLPNSQTSMKKVLQVGPFQVGHGLYALKDGMSRP